MLSKDHRTQALKSALPKADDVARRHDSEVVTKGSTVPERQGNRDANGRFLPGNDTARQRRLRQTITKALGRCIDAKTLGAEARAVADDAFRLFCATLSELPNDGATVRTLVASKARHDALAAFWALKAGEYDLTSEESIKAQEQATKHAARAERLAVTALDVSQRIAILKAKTRKTDGPAWFEADGVSSEDDLTTGDGVPKCAESHRTQDALDDTHPVEVKS